MSHFLSSFDSTSSDLSFVTSSLTFIQVLQVKKHIKKGPGQEGGIFSVEAPLHVSNVQIVDSVNGESFEGSIKDGERIVSKYASKFC